MKVNIAIVTPVEVEYNAVRQHLKNIIEERKTEGLYEIGKFQSKAGDLSIVIHQADMLVGNMAASIKSKQ